MPYTPRILIAAQDDDVCNFIQVALAPRGFMLRFVRPDAPLPAVLAGIATDVLLVDGADSGSVAHCRAIRQQRRWQALPILFLSHDADDEDRTEPVFLLTNTPAELDRRVRMLLRRVMPAKPMLRGFVHEISNTLTSNMLVLATAFEADQTLGLRNAELLAQVFALIDPCLAEELREQVLDCLHRIDENEETLDRVVRLVNDANERAIVQTRLVSDYAKLEYLPMTIQALRPDQEAATVVAQYRERFDRQGIRVTITGAWPQPLFGHRPHLRALFGHLFDNACQAFAEGASVSSPIIDIVFDATATAQRVGIRDNAGGIPPIHLSEVFEPFYTTRPKTNAGLGLCFAAKLAALHGGSITLDSADGEGTRVEILFPAETPVTPSENRNFS